MTERVGFEVEAVVSAPPEKVFDTWLSSNGHAAMTGAPAEADAIVGGEFKAWGDYITGTNLEVQRPSRIVQAWRTSDFDDGEPDSRVCIELSSHGEGTRILITHQDLPPHGTQYEQGWQDHYFSPMKAHFEG